MLAWLEKVRSGSRLEELAQAYGTPFFLYDLDEAREELGRAREALAALSPEIFYAVKANPSLALLEALRGHADGLDVASIGEVRLAVRAGWPAALLSFAGPGKRDVDLVEAIALGVGWIVVESVRELDAIAAIASDRRVCPRVMLRVNPRNRIHAFAIPIAGTPSPFGVDEEDLDPAAERLAAHVAAGRVRFDGVHVHAGSQCASDKGLLRVVDAALDAAERLHAGAGLSSTRVDFGGGFGLVHPKNERQPRVPGFAGDPAGIRGHASVPLSVCAGDRRHGSVPLSVFAAAAAERVEAFRARTGLAPVAVFEPGRYLVAGAGVYVARVVSTKSSRGRRFAILDGGMNHLFAATGMFGRGSKKAPGLPVENVSARPDAQRAAFTIAGPLCTPLDVLAEEVELAEPAPGDLIAFLGAGAYGYTLSPLAFLGHDTPAELVQEGGEVRLARPRRSTLE